MLQQVVHTSSMAAVTIEGRMRSLSPTFIRIHRIYYLYGNATNSSTGKIDLQLFNLRSKTVSLQDQSNSGDKIVSKCAPLKRSLGNFDRCASAANRSTNENEAFQRKKLQNTWMQLNKLKQRKLTKAAKQKLRWICRVSVRSSARKQGRLILLHTCRATPNVGQI